jgi:hypothetical protein
MMSRRAQNEKPVPGPEFLPHPDLSTGAARAWLLVKGQFGQLGLDLLLSVFQAHSHDRIFVGQPAQHALDSRQIGGCEVPVKLPRVAHGGKP